MATKPMPSRDSRGGESTSWTGQPPVCEPTKPSGTPASHGGDKKSGGR